MITGQVVDERYEILQPLGEGGFGNVFLAVQRGFDRRVALKILRNDLMDDEMQKRFHREAKLLSMMHHPNIALFVGSGVWEHNQYTALEFIAGETLHQRLLRGRLNGAEIKSLAMGILAGLAHAHNAGVIHRDLKPANIVLQQDSNLPKLIDFGLACTTVDQQKLTQEGCAIGTTMYMAPEQCMGLALTPAADLYALGCILHQCATGVAAFDADDPVAIMFKHLNEAPRTILTKTASEEQFVEWLEKLLDKDPSKRYATADDAMDALKNINLTSADFADIATTKAKKKRDFKWNRWAWIAAACCGGLMVGILLLTPKPPQNTDFGLPISNLEAKMSDSDLTNIVDTRLNIINRALKEAQNAPTPPSTSFRDDVERALGDMKEWTAKRKLQAQHQQVLIAILQLPWHATTLRRRAVMELNYLDTTDANQAGNMESIYVRGLHALLPPETPQDLECIPTMYMRAEYFAHVAGNFDERLELVDQFASFNKRYNPDSALLAQSLTVRALLMQEKQRGTPADRIAAAQAGFEASAKLNSKDRSAKSLAMIQMARIMAENGEWAKAAEYFQESHSYLDENDAREFLTLAYTLGEQAGCEQRLGRTKAAGTLLARAESMFPTDEHKSTTSHGWFLLAGLREFRHELPKAFEDYKNAVSCAKTKHDRTAATEHLKWCAQAIAQGARK